MNNFNAKEYYVLIVKRNKFIFSRGYIYTDPDCWGRVLAVFREGSGFLPLEWRSVALAVNFANIVSEMAAAL